MTLTQKSKGDVMKPYLTSCVLLLFAWSCANAQSHDWYSQGSFAPKSRIAITLNNDLPIERIKCPVIISRADFPMPDVHAIWVTVVDPSLPPAKAPSKELLVRQGGHQLREEKNGHAVFHQLDDLDKDGIWDELFFQTDIQAKGSKTVYVYIGQNTRGWNKHGTHANIGSYCRHQMPFWESESVGWKIWFANCVDVYAKRGPVLMSNRLYMDNLDGYGVSHLNRDYGSDIQSVAGTFGGGAICLFEHRDIPEKVSLPRFTPTQKEFGLGKLWNAGQISDTRYAYEVIVNGPVRSMIKIKTMNWDTGAGRYELQQYYTAYAGQSYSTCKVKYSEFKAKLPGVRMGCGIRKKPGEENLVLKKGIIISSGPEEIKDPENIYDRKEVELEFIGKAIVVKDCYDPEYQFVKAHKGNHAFKVTPDKNNVYEYMIFAAWSEGAVLNTKKEFEAYVLKTAQEFNTPLRINVGPVVKAIPVPKK